MVDQSDVGGPAKARETTDNVAAPIVYFDDAPTAAVTNGNIAIVLTAVRNLPGADGRPVEDNIVTGHLRCSIQSLLALRATIDGALLLATPTEGTSN